MASAEGPGGSQGSGGVGAATAGGLPPSGRLPGSDPVAEQGWPPEVLQAFRDHGSAITWPMAQSLAGAKIKELGIKYGANTKRRYEEFVAVMTEEHGPRWKTDAANNARVARARLDLAKAEAAAKVAEQSADLLMDGDEEGERALEPPLPGTVEIGGEGAGNAQDMRSMLHPGATGLSLIHI